ncbi:hypothetical protein ACFFRR_006205 [Megaselia abdita]
MKEIQAPINWEIIFEFTHLQAYPLRYRQECLIVPVTNLISWDKYFINPFNGFTWIALFIAIIAETLTLKFFIGDLTFLSIKRVLSFINLGAVDTTVYNPSIKRIMISILFAMFGIIISNLHKAHFSSYMTTYVYGRPVTSHKDIVDQGIRILGLGMYKFVLPEILKGLVINTDEHFMLDKLFSFNSSFGYIIQNDQIRFFLQSQKFLKKKIFESKYFCDVVPTLAKALIAAKPPVRHQRHLKIFTLLVQQSGLDQIWEEKSYLDASKIKLFKPFVDNPDVRKPLNLEYYFIAWVILGIGLVVSFVSFIIEYKRYK